MTRLPIVMNADYCCGFPLSTLDKSGHLQVRNPASLPISEALVAGLADGKDRFDETLNQQYPPESGFGSPGTDGIGLADTALYDVDGALGRDSQSLFVTVRR